jgi:hypothetical protein
LSPETLTPNHHRLIFIDSSVEYSRVGLHRGRVSLNPSQNEFQLVKGPISANCEIMNAILRLYFKPFVKKPSNTLKHTKTRLKTLADPSCDGPAGEKEVITMDECDTQ